MANENESLFNDEPSDWSSYWKRWIKRKDVWGACLIFILCCSTALISFILGGISDGMVDLDEMTIQVSCLIKEHRINCTNSCLDLTVFVPANYTSSGCSTTCSSQVLVMFPSSIYNTTVQNLNQTRSILPYDTTSTYFNYTIGMVTKCFVNSNTLNMDTRAAFMYTVGQRLAIRTSAYVLGFFALTLFAYLCAFITLELSKVYKQWKLWKEQN